ncbi:phage recombination protein Bet [Aggregicoccus sp. 17bor-14]|uniref:phage recombination protein Bet n=1 Tax=Myxococcaceae TaxID=31 RepID=UPI0012F199E0|nr:phage recombination protein Bet [Simulacricoccus sp. 17bor-14]MRI88557.1 phage recombination protein Bet [Aggregicoccus sp. 17bor-14]
MSDQTKTTESSAANNPWSRERVELIKRTICPKGIGDDEFALFIEQCKRSGLDPLLKEAFCVARRANTGTRERPNWTTKYEFQPSEAGMLARAERFPDFKGIQASAVYAEDEIIVDQGQGEVTHRFNPAKRKGSLAGAWSRVVREGKLPVVVWLDFAGYVQQSPLWSKIPTTMIEKCARVAALRKAYPEAFGGLYVREEMPAEEFVDAAPAPAAHAERSAPAAAPAPAAASASASNDDAADSAPYEVLGGKGSGSRKASFSSAPAAAAPAPAPAAKAEKVQPTQQLVIEVQAADGEGSAQAANATSSTIVAFGPHKGRTAGELSDEELSETIELAHEKLMEQPKAKWAKAIRDNLTALEAETHLRFRVVSPSARNGTGQKADA